jgi:protein-disulfide isomerase
LKKAAFSHIILIVEEKRLTKKDLKALRKLEKLDNQKAQARSNSVKWIAITVISFLFFAFFVGLILVTKNNQKKAAATPITLSSEGHIRGASTSAVTLVEYSDLQCPACQAYHPTVLQLLEEYDGRVNLLFKHFPLGGHKNAMAAAIAAEASGRQDKFFQMVDVMYERQREWENLANPTQKFIEYATELELNIPQFQQDLEDDEIQKLIEGQQDEGIKNGVNSTPTFFLNSKVNPGGFVPVDTPNAGDVESFKKILDEALK